jgi:hypothetical protein
LANSDPNPAGVPVDENRGQSTGTTKDGPPMDGKICRWKKIAVLLVLFAPTPAMASDWGDYFWWWPAPRFARGGDYSPMHYWLPERYYAREYLHPSYLDQYPPGPNAPIEITNQVNRYCSPSIPPMPSAPYADPEAYYGRPVTSPAAGGAQTKY